MSMIPNVKEEIVVEHHDTFHRRKILQNIIQNINYDYENCLNWICHFEGKFGYITMAQYIRIIESKSFSREAKDELLKRALMKMDFGCYENFFLRCRNINELYQKIFMLMTIEYLFDYMNQKEKGNKNILSSYIVWEVIVKYFVEEYHHICPYDMNLHLSNEYSALKKIQEFFLSKNIDLQDKLNYYTQQNTLFESIMNYFYKNHSH